MNIAVKLGREHVYTDPALVSHFHLSCLSPFEALPPASGAGSLGQNNFFNDLKVVVFF